MSLLDTAAYLCESVINQRFSLLTHCNDYYYIFFFYLIFGFKDQTDRPHTMKTYVQVLEYYNNIKYDFQWYTSCYHLNDRILLYYIIHSTLQLTEIIIN